MNFNTLEIKTFLPAKDFSLAKDFYQDLGFDLAWSDDQLAHFRKGSVGFFLQDFYVQALAENLMMHLLVEDVDAWHNKVSRTVAVGKYGATASPVETRPWGLQDFTLADPSGVLWRIAQKIP